MRWHAADDSGPRPWLREPLCRFRGASGSHWCAGVRLRVDCPPGRPGTYLQANVGLALMIILDLFPGGVIQLWDSIANGYWHARRLTFLMGGTRSEEHTSELQSLRHLVCRLLLEKK